MDPIIYFVIMEDDTKTHELLFHYFKEFPNFECKGCFTSAGETRDFLLQNPVHLLVADIQLPDMNGMEMIKSLPNKPLVIFMTGHNSKKTATKSYAFDAVHYLTKPFSFGDFKEAMQRTIDRINGKPKIDNSLGEHVMFGTGAIKERVLLSEIRYVEVKGNQVTIYLANEHQVSFRQTLKEVADMLPKTYFLRVHQSYIISLWQLRKLSPTFVTFFGTDAVVPVSRSYRAELRARFQNDPSAAPAVDE
ncbi:LytR/AlgR family response regulator transcription factor [Parapedobacter sp. GCM10030251]|uniref:LytR/AlgR family response regulator transcription factor n=1 Tax=Parapedobacter sp. GCM10030251 TaxID=3273419 RepID=UPI003622891D